MSINKDGRVLSRMGAHELTAEETRAIVGNGVSTRASQTPTGSPTNPDTHFDS